MFKSREGSVSRGVLVAVAATLGAVGCSGELAEAPVEGDLAAIRQRGQLIMLAWPDQESTFVRRMVKEYGEEGLNRFAGIDVELMERFAAELGVSLEVKPMTESFAQLIPSLLAGDGDLVASSMTITEARRKRVDFSDPYHQVGLAILVPREKQVASVDDLAGMTASAVRGSSHEEHLRALGLDDEHLVFIDFALENYSSVADGDADFTLVDSTTVDTVLPQYEALRTRIKVGFEFPVSDHYGVAVRRGSDLLPALNAFLARERTAGRLSGLATD